MHTTDTHVSGTVASLVYLGDCHGSFVCEGILCNQKINNEHKSAYESV